MGIEAIRVDVVTKVQALKATASLGYALQVEFDNVRTVNLQTQTDPFLRVEIKHLDAEQADLSDNPLHRFYGSIVLQACVPAGSGTRKANLLLEHFYAQMQRSQFGLVRTVMAKAGPTEVEGGLEIRQMLVPFWSDQPT